MGNVIKKLVSIITLAVISSSLVFSINTNKVKAAQTEALETNKELLNLLPEYEENVEKASTTDYGLAKNIQDGAILHAWCWSFNSIKENMKAIAESGYTSVQTSPAQACKNGAGGSKDISTWWWHYQPTDYTVGNYQMGTEEEFKAMCTEAHKYGVNIIVDAVMNHMTSDWNAIAPSMQNRNYYHTNQQVGDWNNRQQVTQLALLGLWDMNTQSSEVQQKALSYLKQCSADGADGFRYDAAKHIELPDDSGFGGNYWPVVLNNGAKFQYGEILQDGISRDGAYGNYMGITASKYGKSLRDAIGGGSISASTASNMQASASKGVVTWVESHDNFANAPTDVGASCWMNDEQIKLTWAVIGARKSGTPLFFSRPKGAGNGNRFPGQSSIGDAGSDLYKNPEVAAVNKFRNAMVGEGEAFEDNNGCLVIKRGNKGAVIINFTSQEKDMSVATGMTNGDYTDQALGGAFTVAGGKLSGKVKARSVAVVYSAEPVIQGAKVSASVESEKFKTDTLDVTMNVSDATGKATYSIDGGTPIEYKDGTKITLGKELNFDESTTITLKATGENGEVEKTYTYTKQDPDATIEAYLKMPTGWTGTPKAYIYDMSNDTSNDTFPGKEMTKVSDGLYSMEVSESYSKPGVIFICGTNRYPADKEKGLVIDGKSMVYDGEKWSEYITEKKLTAGKISTDVKSPQEVGNEITISTGNATGGDGDITYQIEVGGEVISKYSSKTEAVWKPEKEGKYTIKVIAKDAKGNTAESTAEYEISDLNQEGNLKIDSIDTDLESPQKLGSTVKFTTTASGVEGDLTYEYKVGETVEQKESADNVFKWIPKKEGEYTITVTVKDEKGNTASKEVKYVIGDSSEENVVTVNKLSADKEETIQALGTTINFEAEVTGKDLEYEYSINGKVVQAFGKDNKFVWTAKEAGDYTIKVTAKDSDGNQDSKEAIYQIKDGSDIQISEFGYDKNAEFEVGSKIKLGAGATSNSDKELTYKFIVKYGKTTKVIQAYSAETTAVWEPTTAGDYTLYVIVKDSDGNEQTSEGIEVTISGQDTGTPTADGNQTGILFAAMIMALGALKVASKKIVK